ncbi:MAG: hypothetical protein C0390_07655 [Syntrophus sp. (in: bacteria)]|nr:hypothetical protein [Syntrophus sp. (in: bacteria)]
MKQSQGMAFFFALALLLCSAMPVGAFEIGARALYWFPTFKADIRVDDSGLTGDNLNLKDTLGVKDESFPSFEVFVGHGGHHLNVAYTPIDYSGSTLLTRKIVFNGQTFAAGSKVDTNLQLKMFDLGYQYDLIDTENILAGFSLGLIVQIKYIDGEAKINAPAYNTGSDFKFRAPMPMLGLGAHVGILHDILEARVKATGIAYSGSYFYEALADLSFTPFPFLDIHAGYKMMRLKIDYSDLLLNTEFAGPFVGLTVSF